MTPQAAPAVTPVIASERSHSAAASTSSCAAALGATEVGQQERREVVEREGLLEAVRRDVAGGEHRARVVGEHVDPRMAVEELAGEPTHLVEPREVGDVLVDRRASRR